MGNLVNRFDSKHLETVLFINSLVDLRLTGVHLLLYACAWSHERVLSSECNHCSREHQSKAKPVNYGYVLIVVQHSCLHIRHSLTINFNVYIYFCFYFFPSSRTSSVINN